MHVAHVRYRVSSIAALVGSALLFACSDNPAPTALQSQTPQATLVAGNAGLELNLDLSAGTVSDGVGNTAHVTPSEAQVIASAFDAFNGIDDNLPALEVAAVPYQNPGCGQPGGWCEQLRISETQAARGGPPSGRRMFRMRPALDQAGRRVRGPVRRPSAPVGFYSNISTSPLGAALIDVPACRALAEAIYGFRVAYDVAKDEYFRMWLSVGFGTAGGIINSSTSVTTGVVIGLGLRTEYLTAEIATLRTQLNILAFLYTGGGCWANNWADRSSYISAGGGYSGPGYFERSCSVEQWWITFDGGGSWEGFWAETCVVVFRPNEK